TPALTASGCRDDPRVSFVRLRVAAGLGAPAALSRARRAARADGQHSEPTREFAAAHRAATYQSSRSPRLG
ncbi:hypothetical protein ACWGCW_38080, partial [Streptomyces sp. NPDC054933]